MAKYRNRPYNNGEENGVYDENCIPYACREKVDRKNTGQKEAGGNPHGMGCGCPPDYLLTPDEVSESMDEVASIPPMSLVPYNSKYGKNCLPPLKRSMSFLTTQELFSYRAIPALGVVCYMGTAVGEMAIHETFESCFGSEYAAINIFNSLTLGSVVGISCYMYGRRHIRHAGAFQKIFYPLFGSLFFNLASHFSWAFVKDLMRDQKAFDHHWRCVAGVLIGMTYLYTGRSYLQYVDHW